MATPAAGEKLTVYRAKRDFAVTSEPAGSDAASGSGRFVVQRHRARRLHYDFRLEVDGVLASWAVPKGPTLDPDVKRLAVHVEDHPIEYADFEGIIPEGEYGGGDVIVWDRGTWRPVGTDDPAGAIASGELHLDLDGEKLKGRFVLIRRGRGGDGDKEQWLMLHKRDEYAEPGWDPEAHPESVKSGRTNEETAANPDAMWDSRAPAAQAEVPLDGSAREPRLNRPARPSPAPPAKRPGVRAASAKEIAALDALGASGEWSFQGRTLSLTNLDKVLWPARAGGKPLSKRDLVRYYSSVAPFILPYLVDRPVNLHRYPEGVDRPGFWQKDAPATAPDWLTRWHRPDAGPGEAQSYFVIDSPPALAWMANHAAVELHPWASRVDAPDQPTWAFIDIDPGPRTTFKDVVVLARLFQAALDHLGVEGCPKVSGQRGIQIWVPVADGYTYDDTAVWIERLSRAVGDTVPELVSWEWRTKARGGRARLDYTQNAVGKTLVAPFSPRPAAGAPVSVPITWDELDDAHLRPDRWTIRTVRDRLREAGDPLAALIGRQQRLPTL
jgi:bifunctional non-homologous end joining protein LigD